MGTKYSKGDVVIKRKYQNMSAMQLDRSDARFWTVRKIEEPESRSPTYVLREKGSTPPGQRKMIKAKASDLKKMY